MDDQLSGVKADKEHESVPDAVPILIEEYRGTEWLKSQVQPPIDYILDAELWDEGSAMDDVR